MKILTGWLLVASLPFFYVKHELIIGKIEFTRRKFSDYLYCIVCKFDFSC